MIRAECPYCKANVEFEHEGNFQEDELYEQTCRSCEKNFVYTLEMTITCETYQAPCLNEGQHEYEKTKVYPPQYAKMRCKTCGDEKPLGKQAQEESCEVQT